MSSRPYLPFVDLHTFTLDALLQADALDGRLRDALRLGNGCEALVVNTLLRQLRLDRFSERQLSPDPRRRSKIARNRVVRDSGVGPVDLLVPTSDGCRAAIEVKVVRRGGRGPADARARLKRDHDKLAQLQARVPDIKAAVLVVGLGFDGAALHGLVTEALPDVSVQVAAGRLQDGTPISVASARVAEDESVRGPGHPQRKPKPDPAPTPGRAPCPPTGWQAAEQMFAAQREAYEAAERRAMAMLAETRRVIETFER